MAIRLFRQPCFWILLLLHFPAMLHGQVLLLPEVQPAGIVLKQQVWSLIINNISGQSRRAILSVSVTDRTTSQVLLEASSNTILLNSGVNRLMYHNLTPLNYSISSPAFGPDRQLNQPLPVGDYLVCYKLTGIDDKIQVLATECVKVLAEPLAPPQLIIPENEAMILDPRPVLTWTPPAPIYMFNSLSYDIIVSPIYEKQSPQEAIQRNLPVMTMNSMSNSLLYPPAFTDLIPGKTYVWQVAARDLGNYAGKSEAWTFTVMPDSVRTIIDNASYVKVQSQNSEVYHLHQGILKIDYTNHISDSVVKASLVDLTESGKKALHFDIKVNAGQNFIRKDINGMGKFHPDHVYSLSITNSRGEVFYFRFVPKYYF